MPEKTPTSRLMFRFKAHTRRVTKIELFETPDATDIYTSSRDKTAKRWRVETAGEEKYLKIIKTYEGHNHNVNSLSIDPNGLYLVTCSTDGTLRMWDVDTGENKTVSFEKNPALLFTQVDKLGRCIVTGGTDKKITILNTQMEKIKVLNAEGEGTNTWITSAAICGAGEEPEILVTGSEDGKISQWNIRDGKFLRTLGEHSQGVVDITIPMDGIVCASAGMDKKVYLWDLKAATDESKGFEIATSEDAIHCIRPAIAYPWFAAATDSGIIVWDVPDREQILEIRPDDETMDSKPICTSLSWGRNSYLYAGYDDGSVAIYSISLS